MGEPVPTCVPPQFPLYHTSWDPVPAVPPDALNVVDWPAQIVEGLALTFVGAVEFVFTVTVTLAQLVGAQPTASRLTKYVVVEVGLTVMGEPVPTYVPPQLSLYHTRLDPVPAVPPDALRVVDWPAQIVELLALTFVGAVELVFTVTVTLAQLVGVPQPPSRLTKYVVVEVGLTVMEEPVPTYHQLPQLSLYHTRLDPVPAVPPDALRVVRSPTQIVEGFALALVGAVELLVFTVTVTLAQLVGAPQPPSRLTKYVVVEFGLTVMEEPVPTHVPPQLPLYHTRLDPVPAVPPDALNVVDWPAQIVELLALTFVGAVELVFTVTDTDRAGPSPQALEGVTVKVPDVAEVEKFPVIACVPAPLVIVKPEPL